jgi:hypothetical protein
MQVVGDGQETAFRPVLVAPVGVRVCRCPDHLVPFHCSAYDQSFPLPTAVQASEDAHATPASGTLPPVFSGLINHRLPFQSSISGRPSIGRPPSCSSSDAAVLPTAKQPVADQHATLDKPPRPGIGWIDHAPSSDVSPPFHRNASGVPLTHGGLTTEPTAKQTALVGHDTPVRSRSEARDIEAKFSLDHPKPFQRSAARPSKP